MSLKYFHIFFIGLSAVLLCFFGYWCLGEVAAGEVGYYRMGAFLSFISAFLLIAYGRFFWKKMRAVGFFLLVLSAIPFSNTWACAICYGDPTHPTSIALKWSVIFLLIVVMGVLGALATFIVHYNRRVKNLDSHS